MTKPKGDAFTPTKAYRSTDTIERIEVNLQTGPDPGGVEPWVLGLGVMAFGVWVWLSPFFGAKGELTKGGLIGGVIGGGFTVFGFGLALMLVGLAILSRRIPALARFGSRHRMLFLAGFITAVLTCFGPLLLYLFVPGARLFGLILALALVLPFAIVPLWLLERRNARRIAKAMRVAPRSSAPAAPPPDQEKEFVPAGELVIELYETMDLPDAPELRRSVSSDLNIVGKQPIRLLYLYNFFADAISARTRPVGGWRLHGPVSMLASPLDLAREAGYHLDISDAVKSRLLSEPEFISKYVAGMSDTPLPPDPKRVNWMSRKLTGYISKVRNWLGVAAHPALPVVFAESGAYPEQVLLCTDGTWQEGVATLTRRCEKAIMDAADFNTDRRGLIWEIHHVLNHFPTEDFVVLINSFTDFPALADEFRRAWPAMSAESPNRRAAEARLRFVLLYGDDSGGLDDDSALGARPAEERDEERIAAHHRIMALLYRDHSEDAKPPARVRG